MLKEIPQGDAPGILSHIDSVCWLRKTKFVHLTLKDIEVDCMVMGGRRNHPEKKQLHCLKVKVFNEEHRLVWVFETNKCCFKKLKFSTSSCSGFGNKQIWFRNQSFQPCLVWIPDNNVGVRSGGNQTFLAGENCC